MSAALPCSYSSPAQHSACQRTVATCSGLRSQPRRHDVPLHVTASQACLWLNEDQQWYKCYSVWVLLSGLTACRQVRSSLALYAKPTYCTAQLYLQPYELKSHGWSCIILQMHILCSGKLSACSSKEYITCKCTPILVLRLASRHVKGDCTAVPASACCLQSRLNAVNSHMLSIHWKGLAADGLLLVCANK